MASNNIFFLFGQVVYEPSVESAVAVLQINSVSYHHQLVTQLSEAATNVCHLLPWVDWDTGDPSRGFTFCWRAEDLVKLVPYAPNVDTVRLLTQ